MSSLHLVGGLPLYLFPVLGCHSVHLLVHLLSCVLARCPAHFHFNFSTFSTISAVPVCFLISMFVILSCNLIPSILLSIALCVVLSFWIICLVITRVWHRYVMVGMIHLSNIFLLRDVGMISSSSISLLFTEITPSGSYPLL